MRKKVSNDRLVRNHVRDRYGGFKIPVFLLGNDGFEWQNSAADSMLELKKFESCMLNFNKPKSGSFAIFSFGGFYYRLRFEPCEEGVYVEVIENMPIEKVLNAASEVALSEALDGVVRNSSHKIFQAVTSINDIFENIKVTGGLKNLDKIADGTCNILRATNLLYEYSLLLQNNMNLEIVDIFGEIDALCSSINSLLRKSGVEFEWSVPNVKMFCDLDVHKFSFALFHIVCNAYNFSSAKVKNAIKVIVETTSDGLVQIEISDRGAGISAEVLENIVKPYFSYDPATGDVSGLGLGLSYVFVFFNKLGGSVSIVTTEEGTRVFLKIRVVGLSDVMGLSSYVVACGIGKYDYMVSTMSRCYFKRR